MSSNGNGMTRDSRWFSSRNERTLLLTLLLVYLALAALALSFHEPFCDEAHVWLSVRDSSLSAVLSRASHAGTPTLWYFMVAPLARLGLPYFSMHLLHLLIATAAVAVLFFRSSLPPLTRILLGFSYYMLFEYAVV